MIMEIARYTNGYWNRKSLEDFLMTRILFIHNTAMWYRIEFFRQLSMKYDLELIFTHMQVIKDVYDGNVDGNIKSLEGVNYKILDNSHGFAKGLIARLFSDYDVVVGGSWDCIQELVESLFILLISKLRRKKLVIWREDWDWPRENNLKQRILDLSIKLLTRSADAVLVPGSLHSKYFKKLGVSDDRIHIMPNVSNISSNIQRIEKKDNREVLYVGRLIKRKGVIYLIKAFERLNQRLSDVHLNIIGDGPEEKYLKDYVHDNNIPNITFCGKIDNDELKNYYINSNLVVIPSINYQMGDPWVFVLNEAMFYNNAVIATDAVGAAEDMIDDNGFIVGERNVEELCEAMYRILGDYDLQKKMNKRSYEIIRDRYQYSNMIDSFDECINDVTGKK